MLRVIPERAVQLAAAAVRHWLRQPADPGSAGHPACRCTGAHSPRPGPAQPGGGRTSWPRSCLEGRWLAALPTARSLAYLRPLLHLHGDLD